MGRLPPKEYTNEPRGGFEQVVEKLPQSDDQQPDNNASWTTVHEKEEEEEVVDYAGARNAKSYFVFGSVLTLLGLAFSLVSMLSCSFANVHWAVDGNSSAYESTLTHIGLFRWYNPKTSSCWAYTQDDTGFFFVDRAARGLSAASVGFGGCAALIVVAMTIANLACCAKKGCCYRFNLNATSLSTTFFALSGLVFTSSILQICTLTYFNQGILPDSVTMCNAKSDSNCTMGVGAHYAIASFCLYLIGSFVYAMVGVGCLFAEWAKAGCSDLEESLLGTGPV